VPSPDDDLRGRFDAAGLGAKASALLDLRRPGVRLISRPADEAELARGSSRLGGRPDLPASFEWPVYRDLPLAFVGQIDLAEMHAYDTEHVLPSGGLLSFFYDADEAGVWGFDPADRGGWAVAFTPAEVALERREHPAQVGEYARFATAALIPQAELGWAPRESSELWQVLEGPAQWAAYAEVTGLDQDGLAWPDETRHRLLGHPDPLQGDMQAECQLVSHGVYCGDPSGYTGSQADALLPGATDWRLLLQVDSDDTVDIMWGDVGRLYYWIQRDRLAERAWDQCWLILQCS
jgi:uncharacterized protein YwqG